MVDGVWKWLRIMLNGGELGSSSYYIRVIIYITLTVQLQTGGRPLSMDGHIQGKIYGAKTGVMALELLPPPPQYGTTECSDMFLKFR